MGKKEIEKRLSLAMLGSYIPKLDGQLMDRPRKPHVLLVYLALESKKVPVKKEHLDYLLYPDSLEKAARTSLRQLITRLNGLLKNGEDEPRFLVSDNDTLRLNPLSSFDLDVDRFLELADGCVKHRPKVDSQCASCMQRLASAISIYRGCFLEGFSLKNNFGFEEWLTKKRKYFEQIVLNGLVKLINYYEARGCYDVADNYAQRQLAIAPWREEGYQQRMRLLARQGLRSDALNQFKICVEQLSRELDVEPSEETVELFVKIREMKDDRPHNLPLDQNRTFVGRSEEMAQIMQKLVDPNTRFLTVVGPGGVGKTELVLKVARSIAQDKIGPFIHGIFILDIVEGFCSKTELILKLASLLEIKLSGQRQPDHYLIKLLRTKEYLLLIDNGEHLDYECLTWFTELLKETECLKLLFASRKRLGLRQEIVFDVFGLPYPEVGVQFAKPFASIDFFEVRAKEINMQFESDYEAAGKIAQLTEGLPLALELAANWSRALSCLEIASEIERSLAMLSTTFSDKPLRHRSMWVVFDQSLRLINIDLKNVLYDLAVFKGGFSRDAAEKVVGASVRDLADLVDVSLLQKQEYGLITRYKFHSLLYQYLIESSNDYQPALNQQHSKYFAELLESLVPKLDGLELEDAFFLLDSEWENIQSGWSQIIERSDLPLIGRYAHVLHDLLTIRGYSLIGVEMLQMAIVIIPPKGELENFGFWSALHARLGNFLLDAGQLEKAESSLKISLSLANQIEEESELRFVYSRLASLALKRGEWAEVSNLLILCRQMDNGGHEYLQGTYDMLEGVAEFHAGHFKRAYELLLSSVNCFEQLEVMWGLGHASRWLGSVEFQLNNYDESNKLLNLSAEVHLKQNDMLGYAFVQHQRGKIARIKRVFLEAKDYLSEALIQAQKIGHETLQTMVEIELAHNFMQQGFYDESKKYIQNAVDRALQLEQPPLLIDALSTVAHWMIDHNLEREIVSQVVGTVLNHPNGSQSTRNNLAAKLKKNTIYESDSVDINLSIADIYHITQQLF